MNLLHFRIYDKRLDSLRDLGLVVEHQPRTRLERLLRWLVGKFGLRLAESRLLERTDERVLIQEMQIDGLKLLELVRDQLVRAHYEHRRPTKVIMGPETYMQIARCDDFSKTAWYGPYNLGAAIPTLLGLELVINPMIEGVAVG